MKTTNTNKIVQVLTPIPTERPYSYIVPDDMSLRYGDFVEVPLGTRKVAAVVWREDEEDTKKINPKKFRMVIQKFDCPPMSDLTMQFVEWVAKYTLAPIGMVLRMTLAAPGGLNPEQPTAGIRFVGGTPERITKARKSVIETAGDMAWKKTELARTAGVGVGVVNGMIQQGLFEEIVIPPTPFVNEPNPNYAKPTLNDEQKTATEKLVASIRRGGYSGFLVDGVTGSGKTEIYLEAIAETLGQGKQVLALLPEIALTASFLERFEARFGTQPAPWHSALSTKKRQTIWRQVAEGRLRVVAGARSALFLPYQKLGLIVVDEEHDTAYKQEDRVYYNARDMAVVRASIGDIPCVMASATPSIESRVNAKKGRYKHLKLTKRHKEATMPNISVVDLRENPPPRGRFISPILINEIKNTLERNEQSLLFLNRRGYAPLTLCRICGHRFQCQDCSAWLVEHRFQKQLQCHHCGYVQVTPKKCPNCEKPDNLVACGPGVERVSEEVKEVFPEASTIILSSDMVGGITRLKNELEMIKNGEADIVIGTQLIAKGHHFPKMTCVGVVDADLGLANGDPRAAERTFQILSQVTGRAGRSGAPSTGILQSYAPDNPVIQSLVEQNPEAFYEREIEARRRTALPPFGKLTSVIVSGVDKSAAFNHSKSLKRAAPASSEARLLGPAEAPMSLVRGRHRYRLLLHTPKTFDVQKWVRGWLQNAPKPHKGVLVQIDIDPQSFL